MTKKVLAIDKEIPVSKEDVVAGHNIGEVIEDRFGYWKILDVMPRISHYTGANKNSSVVGHTYGLKRISKARFLWELFKSKILDLIYGKRFKSQKVIAVKFD